MMHSPQCSSPSPCNSRVFTDSSSQAMRMFHKITDFFKPLSVSSSSSSTSKMKKKKKKSSSKMAFVSTPDSAQEDQVTNWLDLPTDVMCTIFSKLSTFDILSKAQCVCSAWLKIAKEPQFYHIIHMFEKPYTNVWTEKMLLAAVDRSCGQLVKISARDVTDKFLEIITEKSTSLRCLRLLYCDHVTDQKLIELVKKHTELEELEICHCSFTIPVFRVVGQLCPKLKLFRLNFVDYWGASVSSAIAENMHELRHLNLFSNNLTDDGLRAILDSCPHLESLDVRRCFKLEFGGDLNERTANITKKLPRDPSDGYDCEIEGYSDQEDCFYYRGY